MIPGPSEVLDLRNNPREQGVELPKGTLLYTMVPFNDMGSAGPYFTEPGRALYWGFHVMIATRRALPRTGFIIIPGTTTWKRGSVADRYEFPDNEMVLLEIKIDRGIIFSNHMLDANPYGYVNYRYGSHDPLSLPVQVNLDDKNISLVIKNTCREHSWSQPITQKVFYYGLLAMIPLNVFKGSNQSLPPDWIWKDQLGRVDVNQSLDLLFAILGSSAIANTETYHENVVETGIRICRPADVIAERSYFVINWETVWLTFIGLLSQSSTSLTIKDYFIHNVLQLIVVRRNPLDTTSTLAKFDRLLFSRIIGWCDTMCDAISFCSINRRLRHDVAPMAIVQKILRLKFMPRMNNFFAVLPDRDTPEREDLLGVPVKSCGHRWWKVGSVLFSEDFDEADDTQHKGARSAITTGALTISRDEDKPLTRAQRRLLARFGSEEANFTQLQLAAPEITPLVRGCNSFIAMMAMLYSMSNYDATPRGCDVAIHIRDVRGSIDLVTKVSASMPAENIRTPATSPLELLTARPTASYREAVRRIAVCGSWLHDNGTPYFFLDPSFSTRLEKAKAFELQRFDITSFMLVPQKRTLLSSEHLKIARIPLTNDLLLYNDDLLIAIVRYSMKGGFEQKPQRGIQGQYTGSIDYDHIIIFFSNLSEKMTQKLRDPALHQVYRTNGIHLQYDTASFLVSRDAIEWWSRSVIDGIHVTEILSGPIFGIYLGLRKNAGIDDNYYAAYMSVCCIIRMILREGCNRVEWRTNF